MKIIQNRLLLALVATIGLALTGSLSVTATSTAQAAPKSAETKTAVGKKKKNTKAKGKPKAKAASSKASDSVFAPPSSGTKRVKWGSVALALVGGVFGAFTYWKKKQGTGKFHDGEDIREDDIREDDIRAEETAGRNISLFGSLKDASEGLKQQVAAKATNAVKGAMAGATNDLRNAAVQSLGNAVGGGVVGSFVTKTAKSALMGNLAPAPLASQKTAVSPKATPDLTSAPATPAATAEPSLFLMDAEAAANAPGASFENDASVEEYADDEKPLTAADWVGWDTIAPEEFWYRVYDVEAGGIESDEALDRRFQKYNFKGKAHFDRVKDAYMTKIPAACEQEFMFKARKRQGDEAMKASAAQNAHLFEPIAGVSLETYGKIMARKSKMAGADQSSVDELYANFGVDKGTFDQADSGWQARMASLKDPATIGAVMGEYAKHFV